MVRIGRSSFWTYFNYFSVIEPSEYHSTLVSRSISRLLKQHVADNIHNISDESYQLRDNVRMNYTAFTTDPTRYHDNFESCFVSIQEEIC
jgi:hypothetical protein